MVLMTTRRPQLLRVAHDKARCRVGRVQAGHRVLINGAAVTAVCSTGNVELVRSTGANHAVDYTKDDSTDRTDRYDLILDNVRNQPLRRLRRALRGRLRRLA